MNKAHHFEPIHSSFAKNLKYEYMYGYIFTSRKLNVRAL